MTNKLKKEEFLVYSALLFSFILYLIGYFFSSNEIILFGTVLILLGNLIYSFNDFVGRSIFFSFNVTYFTFIMARPLVKIIFGYNDIYNTTKYGFDFFSETVTIHIFQVIYLGLFGLTLGYLYFEKYKNSEWQPNIDRKNKTFIDAIKLVSLLVFYSSFIFSLLITIEKAGFSNSEGYYSVYSSYSSRYPFIFTKISEMNQISLFVFLGCLPSRGKAFFPVFLYIILGGISLMVGQRNIFVLNVLIVFIYLTYRNFTDERPWLSRRVLFLGFASIPLILLLLNFVNRVRTGVDFSGENNPFLDFLYSQGVSANLIGHAENLSLSSNKEIEFFTFGRLIDFFNNNVITSTLFSTPQYSSQTLDSALYGHSFADTISYLVSPVRYLKGWGYGSSYLAETYYDFGKLGVVIFSIFIGWLLIKIKQMFTRGPILMAFGLSMVRLILYSPRDTALSFFVTSFNITNIITVILIYLIAKIFCGITTNSHPRSKTFSYGNEGDNDSEK